MARLTPVVPIKRVERDREARGSATGARSAYKRGRGRGQHGLGPCQSGPKAYSFSSRPSTFRRELTAGFVRFVNVNHNPGLAAKLPPVLRRVK